MQKKLKQALSITTKVLDCNQQIGVCSDYYLKNKESLVVTVLF